MSWIDPSSSNVQFTVVWIPKIYCSSVFYLSVFYIPLQSEVFSLDSHFTLLMFRRWFFLPKKIVQNILLLKLKNVLKKKIQVQYLQSKFIHLKGMF